MEQNQTWGARGDEMGIALFLYLLAFKSVDGDLFGLPIFFPISNLLPFPPNLSIFGLIYEGISKQYPDKYITISK